jgi:hypothetical protein
MTGSFPRQGRKLKAPGGYFDFGGAVSFRCPVAFLRWRAKECVKAVNLRLRNHAERHLGNCFYWKTRATAEHER